MYVINSESALFRIRFGWKLSWRSPILNGDKKQVGWAEITKIVSARPKFMPLEEIEACGFTNIDEAIEYAKKEHSEEYERDGVLTVFHYKVVKLNNI